MADNKIASLLDKAQHSTKSHPGGIKELEQACLADPKAYTRIFLPLVARILPYSKKEPCIDRVIRFLATFVNNSKVIVKDLPVNIYTIKYFLPFTALAKKDGKEDIGKAVRYRAVQIVATLLNEISSETEFPYVPPLSPLLTYSDNLLESIEGHLIERCRDAHGGTRDWAILGLAQIHNAADAHDPSLQEYLRLLSSEPQKYVEIRKAKLMSGTFV